MKFSHLVRSAAMATTLLAMPTPSFAAIDLTYGGAYPALDQQCEDQLNPNDNSNFTTYAIVTGTPSVISSTVDTGPTTYVGIGSATVTQSYRDAHVNGKSVNIHAYGDHITTYADAAGTTPTLTTVTTTVTAGCHVHKPTNGNSPSDTLHEDYIAPNGLQGLTATSTTTTTTPGTRSSTYGGPWIDPNATVYGGEFVICISPSSTTVKGNPGVWRGQNGYVSQLGRPCSTAWHDSLGTSVSVSLPPV